MPTTPDIVPQEITEPESVPTTPEIVPQEIIEPRPVPSAPEIVPQVVIEPRRPVRQIVDSIQVVDRL